MKISNFTPITLPRLVWIILLVITSCVEPYSPSALNAPVDILVVDGFMNITDKTAKVQLSKATPLSASGGLVSELNAFVRIEDERGNVYPLQETGDGLYIIENMNVDPTQKYRVSIRTNNDSEYASEFVAIRNSPPIDSISYAHSPQSDGLSIYANTHDPSGNTTYYQWTFEETWEYTAGQYSSYKIKGGKVVLQDEQIYYCWTTKPSTEIYVASTKQLTEDAVRNFELMYIPKGSQKLTRKYSIEVQQRALTKEAYDYWTQLKKTTESLGGLFDPMPSEVVGNIKNTTDPSKTALGYFSAGQITKQRIFIRFIDIPKDLQFVPTPQCPVDSIPPSDVRNYPDMPIIGPFGSPVVRMYLFSGYHNCMDCRDDGGHTEKPPFWE